MEDEIEQSIATKQEWKTRKGKDRRIKDGTVEDRKNAADAIRRGRQMEKDKPVPWWAQLWRTIFS